jgi:hypothetical protein
MHAIDDAANSCYTQQSYHITSSTCSLSGTSTSQAPQPLSCPHITSCGILAYTSTCITGPQPLVPYLTSCDMMWRGLHGATCGLHAHVPRYTHEHITSLPAPPLLTAHPLLTQQQMWHEHIHHNLPHGPRPHPLSCSNNTSCDMSTSQAVQPLPCSHISTSPAVQVWKLKSTDRWHRCCSLGLF